MRQSMTMRMQQNLTLAPQVQHALRLLRMSAPEFTQEVEQALTENPFLEKDEEHSSSVTDAQPVETVEEAPAESGETNAASQLDEGAPPEAFHSGNRRISDDEESDWTERAETPSTLHSHLHQQLMLSTMGERDRALAQLVIESLDDDGYLRTGLDELAALVPAEHDVRPEELAASLKFVQSLDPAGVGARTLQECLQLQLEMLPEDTPARRAAIAIVHDHLPLLGKREWDTLQHQVGCDEATLHTARALIRSLDPRPGRRFGADEARYVVPDVIVKKVRGKWVASINPGVLPRIHINQRYAEALASGGPGNPSLARHLQEARWLLHSMAQRFTTIQRVADAVVARQRAFLDYGDAAMKPLALKNIADEVGLHESTVCRVANGKYMATPRGVFEFRHFFSRKLATENGGTCSATAIRALMKELIASEDPRAPLSDADLARLLGQQGLLVARRTIAKYRTLMRTPSVELRRVRPSHAAIAREARVQ
jgi:RNA polymerase sigma-54 factor